MTFNKKKFIDKSNQILLLWTFTFSSHHDFLIMITGMVSCDTETYTHSRLRQHHFKDVPAKELKGLTDVGVIREYTEDSSQISFLALPLHRHTRPVIARERLTEKPYSALLSQKAIFLAIQTH